MKNSFGACIVFISLIDFKIFILEKKHQTKWHIEDDQGRSEVQKIAYTDWRNFKKNLNSMFRRIGRNLCEIYPYLDQKEWEKFVKIKSTKESEVCFSLGYIYVILMLNYFLCYYSYVKERSEKGRAYAKLNTNPPWLGARGYRGMKETWSKEMAEPGALCEI